MSDTPNVTNQSAECQRRRAGVHGAALTFTSISELKLGKEMSNSTRRTGDRVLPERRAPGHVHSDIVSDTPGMATFPELENCADLPRREKRDCAMLVQETFLQRLGRALNVQLEDVTHEPLPRRWIDLIQHLNEQAVQNRRERRDEPRLRGLTYRI